MRTLFFSKRFLVFRTGLVFLLVFLLVFELVPLPLLSSLGKYSSSVVQAAISQPDSSTTSTSQSSAEKNSSEQSKTNPQPKEIIEKRTATTKTFDKGNGTYAMELYSAPVHYLENGTWKDIDSNIKQNSTGDFENTANRFKAKFAPKSKSPNLFSFEYDGAKVTYSLAESQAADVTPKVDGDRITYENILSDTDLREMVSRNGVKEDIILKKYTGKNTFTFELKAAGVKAVKEADGSISFYRKGKEPKERVFFIPRSYMVDSNIDPQSDEPKRSDNVTADIVQKGASTYITITADDAWLKSPERVYPVYIDPWTYMDRSQGDPEGDSYTSTMYPDTNFDRDWNASAGYYQMKCGYYPDGITGTNYPYIQINTSRLNGKLITLANFKVFCQHSYYVYTLTPVWLNICTNSWNANTITYNNRPGDYGTGISTSVVRGNWAVFDVTSFVGSWTSGWSNNFGFMLHENGNGQTHWKKFRSQENNYDIPHLYVEYYDPPGISSAPYGNAANSSNGFINLSWDAVPGATGYKLWIYNGSYYESFDVGNTTSWSTQGRGIWPTASEIATGRYALHHDGAGTELADDPSPVYRNSGGSYPNNQNYWFRVSAYNAYSETTIWANVTTPYIPDRTAPPAIAKSSVSLSHTRNADGTINIKTDWTGINDYITGSNYGTNHYNLELEKLDATTGSSLGKVTATPSHTGTGTHTYTFSNVPGDLHYKVHITTYDNNGNFPYSGSISNPAATTSDLYDPAPPTTTCSLEGTLGENGWYTSDVTVTISASDGLGSGISGTEYSFDNTSWIAYTAPFVLSSEGMTTAYYRSADNAGNAEATKSEIVKISKIPVAYASPAGGAYNSAQQVMLSANKPASIYYTLDETTPTASSTQYVGLPIDIIVTTTLKFIAIDTVGNQSQIYTETYTIDTAAPTVNISSPADGSLTNDATPQLEYTATDSGSGISSIVAKVDGATVSKVSGDSLDSLSDVQHTVVVTATDAAVNSSSAASTFTVDAAVPTASATPIGGLYNSAQSVDLAASKPASIYYTTGGTTPTASSIQYIGLPISVLGTTTLKFIAIDQAGNQSQIYTETYTIDLISPGISITSPSNDSTVTAEVTITASGSDNLSLSQMGLTVKKYGTNDIMDLGTRDETGTSCSESWHLDTAKLTDGEYVITLSATDTAGNSSSTQVNIKVANIPEKIGLGYWGMSNNRYGKVNIASGNFVVSQADVDLPGRGLGTDVVRVYNSQAKISGPLGWGWRLSVPEISEYSDGSVVVIRGDATKLLYTKNIDGTYKRPAGSYESLTKNADNTFTWKFKDGTKYIFNRANRKVAVQDKNGNTVLYQCDSSNRLASITDPSGRITNLSYDAITGKLASVQDYTGRTWSYTYDANGDLVRVTDPLNYGQSFAYDTEHKLTSITDENTNTASFTYSGNKLATVKDPAPLNSTTSYGYPASGQFEETDARNNKATYVYNANWNITSVTDAKGNTTEFTYDENYNVLTNKNALGKITTYTYDSNGNVLSVTNPLGDTVSFTYDADNNMLSKTNARNFTTTYAYDSRGNKIVETDALNNITTYTYDEFGNMLSMTDELGHKTTYAYDAYGNQTGSADAQNHTTSAAYNAQGNKVSDTDGNGFTTNYAYDVLGRMLSTTDPENKVTTYQYDGVGNKTKEIDAKGNPTAFEYDVAGNLTKATDALGHASTYAYDSVGNKINERDAEGKTTDYTYDELNRMLSVTVAKLDTTPTVTSYTYDAVGNKLISKDSKGVITAWEYDDIGRVTKLTEPGNKVTLTSYDKNGNVISQTAPNTKVTTNVYDELDRLTQVNNPDGKTVKYTYDAEGNKKTVVDSHGTTTYEYDACDELIKETKPSGKTITYTYDATHKLSGKVADGKGETYNYDKSENLISIVESSTGTHIADYTYDANRNKATESLGDGSSATYTYDAANRIIALDTLYIDGVTPGGLVCTYYANDQIKSIGSPNVEWLSDTYEYDAQNRLSRITAYTGQVTEYTFDSVGNRILMSEPFDGEVYNTTYTYDTATNQLLKLQRWDGTTVDYAYDANGNTIGRKRSGESTETFEYNSDNQLTKVTKPNGDKILFTYDGDNTRTSKTIVKTVNGTTTTETVNYLYEDDLLVAELDQNGSAISRYTYDDKGAPVSVERGGVRYYFHLNILGDVEWITNGAEEIQAYGYDPYGHIIDIKSATFDTPFTYRAKYGYIYDQETGLYFLKSRYYDPEIGRFTTKDRFEGFEDAPASQHPYIYCGNDPVNKVDPDGEWFWVAVGAAWGAFDGYTYAKAHNYSGWKVAASIGVGAGLGAVTSSERLGLMAFKGVMTAGRVANTALKVKYAARLADTAGRNVVRIDEVTEIGLKGKAHFEKAVQMKIRTPHVHNYTPRINPRDTSKISYKEYVRPAKWKDLRAARKVIKKSRRGRR